MDLLIDPISTTKEPRAFQLLCTEEAAGIYLTRLRVIERNLTILKNYNFLAQGIPFSKTSGNSVPIGSMPSQILVFSVNYRDTPNLATLWVLFFINNS